MLRWRRGIGRARADLSELEQWRGISWIGAGLSILELRWGFGRARAGQSMLRRRRGIGRARADLSELKHRADLSELKQRRGPPSDGPQFDQRRNICSRWQGSSLQVFSRAHRRAGPDRSTCFWPWPVAKDHRAVSDAFKARGEQARITRCHSSSPSPKDWPRESDAHHASARAHCLPHSHWSAPTTCLHSTSILPGAFG